MIQLDKVNKYYNKGRSNEIHVIDNTTMTLPDKGMVCLLGPSGCGKTTLLNAIGGLDKVDSGQIYIDDQLITRSSSNKVDTIRNARIGYIFQNFNLIDDKTVFENVAIALRMIGIKDPKIIQERVNYCLEKVGIYQYRNRKTSALSGGQRQRVAIARAIVKNPRIIIADEPTGNLDSANTLEIMNIIKTISRERLVILVTHERKIAEFYSDHVAEMKDGRIIRAYNNDSSRYLDYQLENKIYLRDMPVVKDFHQDDIDVKVYSDEERQADIKVVIKGNNLYINTGGRLNVVDETSNVEMVDANYRAMDESYFRKNDFDFGAHLPKRYKTKYTSLYNPVNMISSGWETVRDFKKVRKFLMVGFVFAAMFALLAVSNVLGILDVRPEDYRQSNGHYITVNNPDKNENLMSAVEGMSTVSYILPGDSRKSVTLPMDDYLQTGYCSSTLNVSLCLMSVFDEKDLVYGEMPSGDHDVILDKMVIDEFFRYDTGKPIGLDTYEEFLGRRLTVPRLEDYRITGISNTGSPSLFVDDSQGMFILTNASGQVDEMDYEYYDYEYDDEGEDVSGGRVRDYALAGKDLKIKKGSAPKNLYEVLVSAEHEEEVDIGKTINAKMAGHKLKVVGYYTTSAAVDDDIYYVSADTVRKDYVSRQKSFTVYAPDVNKVKAKFDSQSISFKVNDTTEKQTYIHERKDQLTSSITVAAVILLVSLIEMFLMLRSSFLSRIKEVGTLRAIGLKKKDIYRMFTGEILVITCITAVPGIALMYYILANVVRISYYTESLYLLTPAVALVTLALLVVFNLFAGLIPVFFTMRKTPAQILARTDI